MAEYTEYKNEGICEFLKNFCAYHTTAVNEFLLLFIFA